MDSEEEYYDSLDEDSNYGSFKEPSVYNRKRNGKNHTKIPVRTRTRPHYIEIESDFAQEDDIIPFYDQNLSKSEVELKKIFQKHDWDVDRQRNKSNCKSSKKKPPLPNVKAKSKNNSYLDMFYAKIGVEKIDFSNRATCTDLTPKNFLACDDLELSSSVYLSEIESVYSSKNTNNMKGFSLSLTSLDSKFCSISQVNAYVVGNVKPKKTYIKPTGIKVGELGRLGPEIPKDKLELFKKRQDYGQKVSRKNKIKMIEKKLLQNLQQEIKECKKIA